MFEFPRLPVVLFASQSSGYRGLVPASCIFDEARDARSYIGNQPVVAHPPCRMWGRYAHLARGSEQEKQLAFFALHQVRKHGGVLEHPRSSALWRALPRPGEFLDPYGGFTIDCNQVDFGHRAEKATRLYLVGVNPASIGFPPRGTPTVSVEQMCRQERERTPVPFAIYLLSLAASAGKPPPFSH